MGGVKNLQVVDPTFNSLKVSWDPAVGNVRSYKVFYTANPDGETEEVGSLLVLLRFYYSRDRPGQNHAHISLNRRRYQEAPPAPP